MKAHIVLAHPERQSFNGLLCETSRSTLTRAGWDVTVSDLYRAGFDPCEAADHYTTRADPDRFHSQTEQRFSAENESTPDDVAREMELLLGSALLVVHFPLWWFGMPAILKGWIDRVFAYGAMYSSTMRYDAGICAGKRMLACVTTGASEDSCSFDGREGDTRLHLWPMLFPFRYVGYDILVPEVLHGIGGVAFVEGQDAATSAVDSYTQRWRDQLTALDHRPSVPYNRNTDFNDRKRLNPDAPSHSPFISHHQTPLWPGCDRSLP